METVVFASVYKSTEGRAIVGLAQPMNNKFTVQSEKKSINFLITISLI